MTATDLNLVLGFLKDLKLNNNKMWFDENRQSYELAKENFSQVIDAIIAEMRAEDNLQGLTAKECMPRINRDIRFSKDKSPYKTNFGAHIAPGGWKSNAMGYYFSIEPGDKSIIAGGLPNPEPATIRRFRLAMDRDAAEFKQITRTREFMDTFGQIQGDRLRTSPQGYTTDHPEIDLLRLKQVTAIRKVLDGEIVVPDLVKDCWANLPVNETVFGVFIKNIGVAACLIPA